MRITVRITVRSTIKVFITTLPGKKKLGISTNARKSPVAPLDYLANHSKGTVQNLKSEALKICEPRGLNQNDMKKIYEKSKFRKKKKHNIRE